MSRCISPILIVLFCLPVCGASGCGGPGAKFESSDGAKAGGAAPGLPPAAPPGGGKAGDGKPEETITRKIIYTAAVDVIVKDVEQTRTEVARIIDEVKGYIAKSDITGQAGTKRTASWTLKVPVEKFQQVLVSLAALGQVSKNSSDSQDVTEEYVDLQARIKNLKVEEELLNKFLKDSVNSVESYLKTREQIKSVRGDIERAEGRLKYLSTMSALSSIAFTAREEQTYDPAPPPAAPTFGDSVDGTFTSSWKAMQNLGKGLVLVVVALAPWLPFLVVGAFLARFAWRRLNRWLAQSEATRLARIAEREERIAHRRAKVKATAVPSDDVQTVDEPKS